MKIQEQLFLQRHSGFEKRFAKMFQKVLKKAYYEMAKNLEKGTDIDDIDTIPMQNVYRRLYLDIMSIEGVFIWNEMVAPLTGQEIKTKDIFDEIASVFSPGKITEMKPFWQRLMSEFLNTYIVMRVNEVLSTTYRKAMDVIERGRNDGLTDKEIARMLRADERSRELRANTIARTETTNAMSKAQILALQSSGLNWEKSWNAIRDERTRLDHWNTDPSLWIDIKENFIIGGFPMAYPGDSTQGSPIKEIINCRCRLAFRLAGRSFGFRPRRR